MYDRNLKAARLAYQKALSLAKGKNLFVMHLKLATVDLFLASTQADIGVDYVQLLEEGLGHAKEALLLNNESAAAYLIAGKLFIASNDIDNAQFALKRVSCCFYAFLNRIVGFDTGSFASTNQYVALQA
jgi:hypothetical protein